MNLNEATIKSLPVPEKGNKVHYFPDAMLQGMPAPRGFGVRITAAGVRSFVLNYRLDSREYRYTIGRYPDWSALRAVREARELRQRIDALAARGSRLTDWQLARGSGTWRQAQVLPVPVPYGSSG